MKVGADNRGDFRLPATVVRAFFPDGAIEIQRLGAGLINDSFVVTLRSGDTKTRAVLQRINTTVFKFPEQVMANMAQVLAHFHARSADDTLRMPVLYATVAGQTFYPDATGDCWRLMSYLEDTRGFTQVQNVAQARAVGTALGKFHRTLADMPLAGLFDTLPGFHITPHYLAAYDAIDKAVAGTDAMAQNCMAMIEAGRATATVIDDAVHKGILRPRVMHGDPKLNNFLFAEDGASVVSLIDLDTVKPGLYHYDIADCIRSVCNVAGEEGQDAGSLFDITYCGALLSGYMRSAGAVFTAQEYALLPAAIVLMPYELGLRFFSDHLQGDRYFKTDHPRHNLQRAQRQFELWQALRAQETALQEVMAACKV